VNIQLYDQNVSIYFPTTSSHTHLHNHTTPTFLDADFSVVSLPDLGAGDGVPVFLEVRVEPFPCSLVGEGYAHVVFVRVAKELAL